MSLISGSGAINFDKLLGYLNLRRKKNKDMIVLSLLDQKYRILEICYEGDPDRILSGLKKDLIDYHLENAVDRYLKNILEGNQDIGVWISSVLRSWLISNPHFMNFCHQHAIIRNLAGMIVYIRSQKGIRDLAAISVQEAEEEAALRLTATKRENILVSQDELEKIVLRQVSLSDEIERGDVALVTYLDGNKSALVQLRTESSKRREGILNANCIKDLYINSQDLFSVRSINDNTPFCTIEFFWREKRDNLLGQVKGYKNGPVGETHFSCIIDALRILKGDKTSNGFEITEIASAIGYKSISLEEKKLIENICENIRFVEFEDSFFVRRDRELRLLNGADICDLCEYFTLYPDRLSALFSHKPSVLRIEEYISTLIEPPCLGDNDIDIENTDIDLFEMEMLDTLLSPLNPPEKGDANEINPDNFEFEIDIENKDNDLFEMETLDTLLSPLNPPENGDANEINPDNFEFEIDICDMDIKPDEEINSEDQAPSIDRRIESGNGSQTARKDKWGVNLVRLWIPWV
ncbi:MAG: hypothetical protein HQK54_04115 [Oligoflexales bacterium]|nr:hypothetical protein [Oligoflexales bacterium]